MPKSIFDLKILFYIVILVVILIPLYFLGQSTKDNFEIIEEDKKTISNLDSSDRTNFEKSKYYQYMTSLENVNEEYKINNSKTY